MKTIVRHVMAIMAFLLIWAVFPNQWLLGLGLDAAWVGLLKILAAIGAAWLVVGRGQPHGTQADQENRNSTAK